MRSINLSKSNDVLFNVVLPVIAGFLIYVLKSFFCLSGLIKNHFADGLWAYSFISSILIIWERKLNTAWIAITFIISGSIELLQHYQIIFGTGDIFDILTYFIFFITALNSNQFFKQS